MNAKEIADLARSTNLTNEAQADTLRRAIIDRAAARDAAGENCDSEDALMSAAGLMADATRNYLRTLDGIADRSVSIAAQIRGGATHVTRSTFETSDAVIGTTAHLGEVYNASVRAWHLAIDLFESVADLVRGTDAEKAEALAKRAADKAATAAAPKAIRRKRAA